MLPEDGADRQLADGFLLSNHVKANRVQVLPPAGGWPSVLAQFISEHVPGLRQYAKRMIVLLIDFDNDLTRRQIFEAEIPTDLKERVFIIGCLDEPESMGLGNKFEAFGTDLAESCANNERGAWSHLHLLHNAMELERMSSNVRPILFG